MSIERISMLSMGVSAPLEIMKLLASLRAEDQHCQAAFTEAKKSMSKSKSLKRVRACLESAGITPNIRETTMARTAADAAEAVGCEIDQIAKSIIFRGEASGEALLFVSAGGNQVDVAAASALAGEPLGKADAALIRAQTGFAIGGVSPVGHLKQPRAWFDPRLMEFDLVWAAAGTPHHVFGLSPALICQLAGSCVAEFTADSI